MSDSVKPRPVNSQGTTLEIGSPAIAVARLSNIGSPKQSREAIDVTTLDSEGGYREYIDGYRDGGEFTVSGYFIFSDPGQKAIISAFEAEGVQHFCIKFPPSVGAKWEFDAVVTGYEITSEVGNAIGFNATFKVSGKPVLSALNEELGNVQVVG